MKTIHILLLVLSSLQVYAGQDRQLMIDTIDHGSSLEIIKMGVIQDNPYYSDRYLPYRKDNTGYSFVFSGDSVLRSPVEASSFTLINYSVEIAGARKLGIFRGRELLYERNISFCNNNGLCEPCLSQNCTNIESQLTCADCKPSRQDGFCNVADDGMCDPDCVPGYIYGTAPDYTGCYEDTYFSEKCSDYGLSSCTGSETCTGYVATLNSGETCCTQGTCNSTIIEHFPGIEKDAKEKFALSDYSWVFGVSGLLILIAYLVFIIKKKKILIISSILVLLAISALLLPGLKTPTGFAVDEFDQGYQKSEICRIAEAYNIDSSVLLTIADIESGVNHWRNGKVLVSYDGGVGIMQIDHGYNFNSDTIPDDPIICGTSKIDGRSLDAKKLTDNIECGALEFMGKCSLLKSITGADCWSGSITYCCPKLDNGRLPIYADNCPPDGQRSYYAEYSGFDIGIKGYNGWGCGPYEANRRYVEIFHEREAKYKDTCGSTAEPPEESTIPGDDQPDNDTEPGIIPAEGLGYYYVNPSFRIATGLDFEIYDKLSRSAVSLIKDVASCSDTVSSCVDTLKENDWIAQCSDSERMCKFDVDTGRNVSVYEKGKYVFKEVIVRFALYFPEDASEVRIEEPQDDVPEDPGEPDVPGDVNIDNEVKIDKIVLFCDSICVGHALYGTPIKGSLGPIIGDVEVNVTGKIGARVFSTSMITMFNDQVLPQDPDVVILWFGMNNAAGESDSHMQTYESHIQKMLSLGISPVLASVIPVCKDSSQYGITPVDDAEHDITAEDDKALADKYNLGYIPARERFKELADCVRYYEPDGVHLSREGHSYFAQIAAEAFTDMKTGKIGPFAQKSGNA